jgi:hypothetical protein
MSFPTTSVLDDFNRADTVPPALPSANWLDYLDGASPTAAVQSNQLGPTNAFQSNYWTELFDEDQEVWATLEVMPGQSFVLVARAQNPNTPTRSYYYLIIWGGGDVYLEKVVAGAGSFLQTLGGVGTILAGDEVGLRCEGSTISAWQNGVQLGTDLTDATITGPGYVGLAFGNSDVGRIDDFGGGSLVAPAPPDGTFPSGAETTEAALEAHFRRFKLPVFASRGR